MEGSGGHSQAREQPRARRTGGSAHDRPAPPVRCVLTPIAPVAHVAPLAPLAPVARVAPSRRRARRAVAPVPSHHTRDGRRNRAYLMVPFDPVRPVPPAMPGSTRHTRARRHPRPTTPGSTRHARIRQGQRQEHGVRGRARVPRAGVTGGRTARSSGHEHDRDPGHDDGAGPEGPAPWRRVEGVRCGYCCPGSLRLSQRSFMRSMKEPPEEDGRDGRPADCPFARGAFAPDFDIRIPGRSA